MQFHHLLMSILTLNLLWIHRRKRICHTGLKIEVFSIVIRPTSGNNLCTFDNAPPVDKYRTAVRAVHEFSSENDTPDLRKFILLAMYWNTSIYLNSSVDPGSLFVGFFVLCQDPCWLWGWILGLWRVCTLCANHRWFWISGRGVSTGLLFLSVFRLDTLLSRWTCSLCFDLLHSEGVDECVLKV